MHEVYQMKHDIKLFDRGLIWNTDLIESLELENLLGTSLIIQFKQTRPLCLRRTGRNLEEHMLGMTIPIETMRSG